MATIEAEACEWRGAAAKGKQPTSLLWHLRQHEGFTVSPPSDEAIQALKSQLAEEEAERARQARVQTQAEVMRRLTARLQTARECVQVTIQP